MAGEHLDPRRAAVVRAEQPEVDLPLVLPVVAAVAARRQRAALPLEEARGQVVEDQRTIAEIPVGQALLDPGLASQQPVVLVPDENSPIAPK